MSARNPVCCHIRYVIDPTQIETFERYARAWIPLVQKFGGTHLGYFLPSEGANNVAYALFEFDSLATYESYRLASIDDPDCQATFRIAEESGCIVNYERTFLKPLR